MAEEALLGAAFGVLLDRLTLPELGKFFRGRNHDASLLRKLKMKLLGLNKVLNDAENKQFTDQNVKAWLDELKGAVYDADDLVDEIAYAALACKVEAECQSIPNQVQSLISSFTGDGVESKIKSMIETLDYFTEGIDALGLTKVDGLNWSQTRLPPTTSLVDESSVYGRENEREEIMKLLLSDGEGSQGIDVIPIVGMGGVGKTTLAQLLYNDRRLESEGSKFVKKAWVCVSDVFDILSITRTIVEAVVDGPTSDVRDLNSLQVRLKESLRGQKFLIVLDDVWNENYDNWNALMIPFKFGARGSKIIVTTRNESVASIMQTVPVHGLKELPEEDGWKLFSKHAFEKGDCNAHPELERIGKEIVKKCGGLPLAVKTLGGLLRSSRDLKDWNNILESAIWELSKEKSNILPALRLSYHYLPSHLKRCFAFCSMFVKDYKFNMEELVSIWMAEGLLVKTKNNKKTVAEEGYECFHELLSRSFFQRSNAANSLFVMHDLVHDLAEYVMGDFCYRLEDDKSQCTSENVRHLSYFGRIFDGVDEFKVIEDAKCLRTFLEISKKYCYGRLSKKMLDKIISEMPRLRLLSLPYYGIDELPDSIGELIHLRFLDLSANPITKLPESICTLYNLETLLLSRTELKEMPVNISRLKGLQRLNNFVVGESSGSGINGLKELDSLRGAITINGLENVTSSNDALEANLKEKKHLEKLTLIWGRNAEDSQKERDVLEKLEPHTNLKHLAIGNYGGTTFPTWLGDESFCNMESLSLWNCVNCFSLPAFGQMPSLQSFELWNCPEIEYFPKWGMLSSLTHFFISNCEKLKALPEQMHTLLPSLQEFQLIECPEIESFPEGGLPSKLGHLFISYCKKLKALPSLTSFTLGQMPSLQLFELHSCPEIESFPKWGMLSSLTDFFISNCEKLKALPEQMHTLLPSLQEFHLNKCPEIESFPEGGLPSKLGYLYISKCKKLVGGRRDWGLQTLPSLTSFTLMVDPDDELESFPDEGLLPPTLTYLCFGFMYNLKSLNERGLQSLVSLQHMEIHKCPELQSLSAERLLASLSELRIRDSPLLESRCRREEGEDWHKIAHIPHIEINGEVISK